MPLLTPRIIDQIPAQQFMDGWRPEAFVREQVPYTTDELGNQTSYFGYTQESVMAGDGITVAGFVSASTYDVGTQLTTVQYYVQVFNRKTLNVIATLSCGPPAGAPIELMMSRDGSTIAFLVGGFVRILHGPNWSLTTQVAVSITGGFVGYAAQRAAISRDGSVICLGDNKTAPHGRALILYGPSWGSLKTIIFPDAAIQNPSGTSAEFGNFVSCSDDGNVVAIGAPEYGTVALGTSVGATYVYSGTLWDTYSVVTAPQFTSNVGYSGAISPDGTKLATNGSRNSGYIDVWTIAGSPTWSDHRRISWNRSDTLSGKYNAFCFSADSNYLWVTAGKDGNPWLRDITRINVNTFDESFYWPLLHWHVNNSTAMENTKNIHVADDGSYVLFTQERYYDFVDFDLVWQFCGINLNAQVTERLTPDVIAPANYQTATDKRTGSYVSVAEFGSAILNIGPGPPQNRVYFNTSTGVDGTTDVVTTTTPHNFAEGDLIDYSRGASATTVGLTNGEDYYVKVLSPTTLTFHTSLTNLTNNVKVNLTPSTSEIHMLYQSGGASPAVHAQANYSQAMSSVSAVDGAIAGIVTPPGYLQSAMSCAISDDTRFTVTAGPLAVRGTDPEYEAGGMVTHSTYSFYPWNTYNTNEIRADQVAPGERWGRALALSDGALVMAISSVNPTLSTQRGSVRIYLRTDGTIGQTIDPPEPVIPEVNDQFGTTLQLKKNAELLFVGAPNRATTSGGKGKIYVYGSTGYISNDQAETPIFTLSETIEDPNGTIGFTEIGNYMDASKDGSVLVFSGKDPSTGEYTIFIRSPSGYTTITNPGALEFGRLVRVTGDGKQIWTIDRNRNVYRYHKEGWSKKTVWANTAWGDNNVDTSEIGLHNQSLLDVDHFGFTIALGDPLGNVPGGNPRSGRVLVLRNLAVFAEPYYLIPFVG
jgi:hypothetical protein